MSTEAISQISILALVQDFLDGPQVKWDAWDAKVYENNMEYGIWAKVKQGRK